MESSDSAPDSSCSDNADESRTYEKRIWVFFAAAFPISLAVFWSATPISRSSRAAGAGSLGAVGGVGSDLIFYSAVIALVSLVPAIEHVIRSGAKITPGLIVMLTPKSTYGSLVLCPVAFATWWSSFDLPIALGILFFIASISSAVIPRSAYLRDYSKGTAN